jgi:bacteriorhodopsin
MIRIPEEDRSQVASCYTFVGLVLSTLAGWLLLRSRGMGYVTKLPLPLTLGAPDQNLLAASALIVTGVMYLTKAMELWTGSFFLETAPYAEFLFSAPMAIADAVTTLNIPYRLPYVIMWFLMMLCSMLCYAVGLSKGVALFSAGFSCYMLVSASLTYHAFVVLGKQDGRVRAIGMRGVHVMNVTWPGFVVFFLLSPAGLDVMSPKQWAIACSILDIFAKGLFFYCFDVYRGLVEDEDLETCAEEVLHALAQSGHPVFSGSSTSQPMLLRLEASASASVLARLVSLKEQTAIEHRAVSIFGSEDQFGSSFDTSGAGGSSVDSITTRRTDQMRRAEGQQASLPGRITVTLSSQQLHHLIASRASSFKRAPSTAMVHILRQQDDVLGLGVAMVLQHKAASRRGVVAGARLEVQVVPFGSTTRGTPAIPGRRESASGKVQDAYVPEAGEATVAVEPSVRASSAHASTHNGDGMGGSGFMTTVSGTPSGSTGTEQRLAVSGNLAVA